MCDGEKLSGCYATYPVEPAWIAARFSLMNRGARSALDAEQASMTCLESLLKLKPQKADELIRDLAGALGTLNKLINELSGRHLIIPYA